MVVSYLFISEHERNATNHSFPPLTRSVCGGSSSSSQPTVNRRKGGKGGKIEPLWEQHRHFPTPLPPAGPFEWVVLYRGRGGGGQKMGFSGRS